jgi:hypothetical protein
MNPLRVIPSFPFHNTYKYYIATPLMINPTMAYQWDPGNFKPLDMSEISGYPRKMPLRYENWLLRFIGNDGVRVEDHMDNV